MKNVKVVFASVVITLVVVFGFMSISSSYADAVRDAPFVLALTIINSPTGGEPVVVNYSIDDFVVEDEGEVYVVQAQAYDAEEEDESDEEEEETVVVDYDKYNIDYIGAEIEGLLNEMIGSKKSVFYLPPTGYINVSRGTSYGVAYALTDIDPTDEYYFVFDWEIDESIAEDCGVSEAEGQDWIERGWGSWGNIPEGRVDSMTVYFSFPDDAPNCTVKYNFVVKKNGEIYDTAQIELRII